VVLILLFKKIIELKSILKLKSLVLLNSRCFESSNESQTYELIKRIEGIMRKPMSLKLGSIKSSNVLQIIFKIIL